MRELRTEKGWRQKDVAEKLNVSAQVYGNYENGINKPDPDMLSAMADLFDVTVDYLIGREPRLNNVGDYDDISATHNIRTEINQTDMKSRLKERDLIIAFRQLDEKNKDIAVQTLQLWAFLANK